MARHKGRDYDRLIHFAVVRKCYPPTVGHDDKTERSLQALREIYGQYNSLWTK